MGATASGAPARQIRAEPGAGRSRSPAVAGVLPDCLLRLGQVYAEGAPVRNVGVLPLHEASRGRRRCGSGSKQGCPACARRQLAMHACKAAPAGARRLRRPGSSGCCSWKLPACPAGGISFACSHPKPPTCTPSQTTHLHPAVAGLAQGRTRGGADAAQLLRALVVDVGDLTHNHIALQSCSRSRRGRCAG